MRAEQAAQTASALKQAAREQFLQRGYLNTKITDITAAAGRSTGSFYDHFGSKDELLQALLEDMHRDARADVTGQDLSGQHPADHDLTDRAQLRAHLAAAWQVMRSNLPVMMALFESGMAEPGSDRAWRQLTSDTDMLRRHLDFLQQRGDRLPGPPELVAAAMGAMLSMLAYSILPGGTAGYSDDQVVDTLTELLRTGLVGGS